MGRGSLLRSASAVVLAACVASAASAGTWSELPEAVARLGRQADDREAQRVVAGAERAVLAEALAGRLDAVQALADAFAGIVAPLESGPARVAALERRVAALLLERGDALRASDVGAAGAAWTLAASYDPGEPALGRLRDLLLPPPDPEPGQAWVSPVNGSALVWVPPYRFIMGCTQGDHACQRNERFLRWVDVPGVWLERSEVTRRMYRSCVDAGACSPPAEEAGSVGEARDDEPVTGVTWHQARAYAHWLGRRLPAESEWERCARGKRVDARYPWGESGVRGLANVAGKSGADPFLELAPVGSFPATGWGHLDLAGNVWEWCEDSYHEVLTDAPRDGQPRREEGLGRVLRGGSFRRTLELARVSSRTWQEPTYVADDVGFRCAADPGGEPGAEALVALARRQFPARGVPGRALEGTALAAEDRRYLERRAVTWLVLEGRSWDALPWALVVLEREDDDPVALGLLSQLEDELRRGVTAEDLGSLEERMERYRAVLPTAGRLGDRRAALEKALLRDLETAGREAQRRNDMRAAAAHFRLALGLQPNEPRLVNLLRAVLPVPGSVRRSDGDGRIMVWVPAGSFLMGRGRGDNLASLDEQPAHTVWVGAFWLDRTEVTNAEFRRCVTAGACAPPHLPALFDDPARADHPVLGVDWYQARLYARWAGKRLPTEAEWERAARAGTTTRYPWGDDWVDSGGNGFGTRAQDRWLDAAPVGSFAANPWGLLDMLGNAWEWVEDAYHSDYRGAPRDGRAWTQVTGGPGEPERVLRGGSLQSFPPKLRVSQRDHRPPEGWSRATGFRCAADE